MADLDHFKNLNDTYGHETGDRALRLFARVLRDSLRAHDLISRYGGEEFAIAFPDCSSVDATRALNTVQAQLDAAITVGGLPKFTSSFGITEIEPGEELAAALRRADDALLVAKRSGRNQIVLHDPGLPRIRPTATATRLTRAGTRPQRCQRATGTRPTEPRSWPAPSASELVGRDGFGSSVGQQRSGGIASPDGRRPTPAQPRLRPAPDGSVPVECGLAGDGHRLSAPGACADPLRRQGGSRLLCPHRPHRHPGHSRRFGGRPLESAGPDDRRRRPACRRHGGPGGQPRGRGRSLLGHPLRGVRRGHRHDRLQRGATGALRAVVPTEQLPEAAGAQSGRTAAVRIVGPPLGGALFEAGRALPFLVDACSYACSTRLAPAACARSSRRSGSGSRAPPAGGPQKGWRSPGGSRSCARPRSCTAC